MGTYDLIDDYLDELRLATRWHADSQAVVDEMADHLLSSTEALEQDGASSADAQTATLARFGSPAAVARALSLGPQGHPAVPTRSTVGGAPLAFAGAGTWVLYALATFAVIHLYDRFAGEGSSETSSSPLQVVALMPWALGAVGGMALLMVTAMILKERHGGFRWTGWAALFALTVGVPLSLIGGWFIPGWGTLLAIGAALLAIELLRGRIAPRLPAIALALGPAVGFAVWGGLRAIELGPTDEFGNYPIPTGVGVAVACALLATGLVGLGMWLRSETPVDLALQNPAPIPA